MPNYSIIIYTGQGIAGPMDEAVGAPRNCFAFYSSDFDSCSPVVMFNTATKIGGLFHMPGNSGKPVIEDQILQALMAVVEFVQPTNVWLFAPGTPQRKWDDEQEEYVAATDMEALQGVICARAALGDAFPAPVFQRADAGIPNILVRLGDGAESPDIGRSFREALTGTIWNAHPKGDLASAPPDGCLFVPGPFNPGNWNMV